MKPYLVTIAALLGALVVMDVRDVAAAPPAEKAEPAPGRVLFVRGDALFTISGDGKGGETELTKLPPEVGQVTSMEASPDGGLVVVRGDKGSAWWVNGETTWRTGCAGRARPSPTNECLVCETAGAVTLLGARNNFTVKLPGSYHDANFLGSARELAVLDADKGVLGFGVKTPKDTRVLARPGATGYLLVSPDGSKAVAVYGRGKDSRVFGLVLDGEGIPRSLGGPAVPVVWSSDSTWALVEYGVPSGDGAPDGAAPLEDDGSDDEGDGPEGGGEGLLWPADAPAATWLLAAPDARRPVLLAAGKKTKKDSRKKKQTERAEPPARVRTCVVRSVGGESKCWNHFSPRAFAPSSDRVLLWKDSALWVGKIPGVRPDPPRRRVEKADGPFAETKELVAGFWIVNVKDKAEAIEWFKKYPFAEGEEIELRRVWEASDWEEAGASPEVIETDRKLREKEGSKK
jgi:hypothetical protein